MDKQIVQKEPQESSRSSGQFPPGRMIVPGAGRGHDVRLFARHGFAVTAMDFAAEAVREMHRLAAPDAPLHILHADLFALTSRGFHLHRREFPPDSIRPRKGREELIALQKHA